MKLRDRIVLSQSSVLGLGYLPRAPGTWGTLGAIPIWWAIADLHWGVAVGIITAIVLYSLWVSCAAEKIYGEHDVGKIVIDEVAGMLVTIIAVPFRAPQQNMWVTDGVFPLRKPGRKTKT